MWHRPKLSAATLTAALSGWAFTGAGGGLILRVLGPWLLIPWLLRIGGAAH